MEATDSPHPDPGPLAARLAQAQLLANGGGCEVALDEALALLDQWPDDQHEPRVETALLASLCLLRLERFEAAVTFMAQRLEELAAAAPSSQRALLLIRMAFAQTQLSRHAPAMRAADLALRDALAVDDRSLVAGALDRLAMSALNLGDLLLSERFMLEALGFYEQAEELDDRLRGKANALFLYCSLYDRLKACGDAAGAADLLQRSQRIVNRANALIDKVTDDYLRYTWRTNEAAWLHRRGELARAEAQMREARAEALRRSWHTMHRPLSLELARLLEARGDVDEAIALLQSLFDPALEPLRDRLARGAHACLQRLLLGRGDSRGAAHHELALQRLDEHMRQQELQAQQHMDDLGDLVTTVLAEADQRRLEDELTRLREQYAADRLRWATLEFAP